MEGVKYTGGIVQGEYAYMRIHDGGQSIERCCVELNKILALGRLQAPGSIEGLVQMSIGHFAHGVRQRIAQLFRLRMIVILQVVWLARLSRISWMSDGKIGGARH